ncbi:unnamed protein product, partial [Mycena citricolor]
RQRSPFFLVAQRATSSPPLMLATMNATVPTSTEFEDRICPGCKLSAVTEQGGLVVAFGQSFFHVDCFKCAKCGDKVTADTNLLLLSDGSPICANCSYSCNVCHNPILDEAIMTGDDSYHAHCFKCKVCKNRIDELVFAKTSQGIYCMKCHNERMIKIRKHTQKKAEREKEKAAAAVQGSTSSREREARPSSGLSASESLVSAPQTPRSRAADVRSPKRPYVSDAFEPAESSKHKPAPLPLSSNIAVAGALPSPSVRIAAPESEVSTPQSSVFHAPSETGTSRSTLPLPSNSPTLELPEARRQSFEDGARRSDNLFPQDDLGPGPTSKRNKRHSINPGASLANLIPASTTPPPTSPSLSPLSATFVSSSQPSSPHHRSRSPSPRLDRANNRPDSTSSNTHVSSPRTPPDDGSTDQTVVMGSSSSQPHVILNSITPSRKNSQPVSHRLSAEGRSSSNQRRPSLDQRRTSSDQRRPSIDGRPSSARSSRADVPHSIESGTDTDTDAGSGPDGESDGHVQPPSPPPKTVEDPEASQLDSSDDMSESSPVEHTSHSTFIAPALPPIRFSMTTSDFSDLFSSVQGHRRSMSLKQLVNMTEGEVPSTPPPTAVSIKSGGSTPTMATSVRGNTTNDSTPKVILPAPRLQSLGKNTLPSVSEGPDMNGSRSRSSSESQGQPVKRIPLTRADSAGTAVPRDAIGSDLAVLRLRQASADARERGATQLKLDKAFVDAILSAIDTRDAELSTVKTKLDGVRRASKQYIDGLTVAQTEYDSEVKARQNAEAEVTRLRVILSGQVARLTALSGDSKRQELRQQLSKELNENLSGLERDLSKLKVERDMAIAEVEELSTTKEESGLSRSLTARLDNIKKQYHRDLLPLREERVNLEREIAELKGVRDVFLEETTTLNARNEELAQLGAQYARRMVPIPETPSKTPPKPAHTPQQSTTSVTATLPAIPPSTTVSSSASDDSHDSRLKVHRMDSFDAPTPSKPKTGGFKWPGTKPRDPAPATPAKLSAHNFQQISVLRFTRCDHCTEKLWGTQLRCNTCSMSVHVRCVNHVQISCGQRVEAAREEELPPSMFGRELVEQAHADGAQGGDQQIPLIVEKCIDAVEALAMDYEGIYRKTGGSGQSKAITQLFERGNYAAFDLCDSDRFNDICSVTSVLKSYFRSLPTPLLTYDLHEQFMSAVQNRDPTVKNRTLLELVNKLPIEHYCTLRTVMLHLHRQVHSPFYRRTWLTDNPTSVHQRSERNLMTARNLGVVFGPTLMRSADPGAEFSDMAGKALSIEWLIENAPQAFT